MSRSPYGGPSDQEYLQDPNVRNWFQTHHLRSENTAWGYLKRMTQVWRMTGLSPTEFVSGDQLELDNRGQEVVNQCHAVRKPDGEPLAYGTIESRVTAMKAWLDWNGREFKREPQIGRAPKRPRASKQQIPVPSDLQAVLDVAPVRTRASISLEAFGGMRPEVQASREGDRGLMMCHITGLARDDDGWFYVEELPLQFDIPDELSKTGNGYMTFLGTEGAAYLVAYLNSRVELGHEFGPSTPVIAPIKNSNRTKGKPFLTTDTICDAIKKAHNQANFDNVPYIWRSYFKSFMELAETKRLVIKTHHDFWMGHTGEVSQLYSVRKILPAPVMDAMRQSYMKAVRYLETRHSDDGDNGAVAVLETILKGLQVPEDELAAIDFTDPEPGQIEAIITARVAALAQVQAPAPTAAVEAAPAPTGPTQRLVAVADVAGWLEQGWTWAHMVQVPEGMALIEAPPPASAGTVTAPAEAPVAA